MTKKTYVRAQAELMNVAAEKTLFTGSSSDENDYDGMPGKWCPEFVGCVDSVVVDDSGNTVCGNDYCNVNNWIDC